MILITVKDKKIDSTFYIDKKQMESNFDIKNIDIFNETFYLLSENEIMKILSSDAKDINNIDNLLKISYKNDINIHDNLNDRKFLTNDELKKEINLLENRINSLKSFNSELNELKESLEIRLKRLKWRMAKRKSLSNLSTIDRRKVWNNSKKNSAKKSAKKKAKF